MTPILQLAKAEGIVTVAELFERHPEVWSRAGLGRNHTNSYEPWDSDKTVKCCVVGACQLLNRPSNLIDAFRKAIATSYAAWNSRQKNAKAVAAKCKDVGL